eukprot:gene30653-37038_t
MLNDNLRAISGNRSTRDAHNSPQNRLFYPSTSSTLRPYIAAHGDFWAKENSAALLKNLSESLRSISQIFGALQHIHCLTSMECEPCLSRTVISTIAIYLKPPGHVHTRQAIPKKKKGKERALNPAIPSMVFNPSAVSQAPFASSLDPVSVADTSITMPESTVKASLNLATYQGPPPLMSPTQEQSGPHLAMQHSSMAAYPSSATLPAEAGSFLFCAIAPVTPSPSISGGVSEVASAGPQTAIGGALYLPSTQQHPLLLATARQSLQSSEQLAQSEYQSLLQTQQVAPVTAFPPSTYLMAAADPSATMSAPFLVGNDVFAGVSGLRCGSSAYLVGTSSVHPSGVAGSAQIQLQQLQPPATALLPLVPTGDSAMTASPSSMGFASLGLMHPPILYGAPYPAAGVTMPSASTTILGAANLAAIPSHPGSSSNSCGDADGSRIMPTVVVDAAAGGAATAFTASSTMPSPLFTPALLPHLPFALTMSMPSFSLPMTSVPGNTGSGTTQQPPPIDLTASASDVVTSSTNNGAASSGLLMSNAELAIANSNHQETAAGGTQGANHSSSVALCQLCSSCPATHPLQQPPILRVRKPYSKLSESQKRRRVQSVIDPILNCLGAEADKNLVLEGVINAHNGTSIVSKRALGQEKRDEFAGLIETYRNAYELDKKNAQFTVILSILRSIPHMTREQCNDRFFGAPEDEHLRVSKHYWQKAGLYMSVNGPGGQQEEPQFKETHTRVDTEKVVRLIQFLSLNDHLQLFAYGVKHHMMTDGSFKTIPSCTRKLPKADLYALYINECRLRGEKPPPREEFDAALEITAANGNDTMLAALDPVLVKDGIDNFEAMRFFVKFLLPATSPAYESLMLQVDKVDVFLRTEFPLHVSEDSTTAFHSFIHVFGASPNPPPTHPPTTSCSKCDSIHLLIHNFRKLVSSLSPEDLETKDPETKFTLQAFITEKLERSLYLYVAHILRSAVEKGRMDKILANLQEDECLMIVDWKMRLLMMLYRESMVQYFGKRGLAWMGIMLVRRKTAAELDAEAADRLSKHLPTGDNEDEYFLRQFTHRFYDGLSDDSKEDSWAVVSHMEGALKHYKQHHGTHITKVHVMTDGAGCLSGVNTLLAAPYLGKWTGIRVVNWNVSETGCGKTPLDAHFCYGRSHAINNVVMGKGAFDIFSAQSAVPGLFQAYASSVIDSFSTMQTMSSHIIFFIRTQSWRGNGIKKTAQSLKTFLGNVGG